MGEDANHHTRSRLWKPSLRSTPHRHAGSLALAIGPREASTSAHARVRFIYVVDINRFKDAECQEPGLYDLEI